MKVVVTGSDGFIGTHLCRKLRELGCVVESVDLKQGIDIGEVKTLLPLMEGADSVFHLAGLTSVSASFSQPGLYFDVNLKGTRSVLEGALQSHVKRFIFAASSSCYGNPSHLPIDENTSLAPENPYALSKVLAEKAVMQTAQKGLIAISLRLFNVYGEGARNGVIHQFFTNKAQRKALNVEGNGSQTRDFIHVFDVVRAFIAASHFSHSSIFNVGSGKETSIRELARHIDHNITFSTSRPNEISRSFTSIAKIKKALGWEPEINLVEWINNPCTQNRLEG